MQSSKSVESIIKSTFALQIGVHCSSDVRTICQKNSLSFEELMKPFSVASGPFQLKDVQGHQYSVRNVHLRFSETQSEPVPETKLRIDLGNRVKNLPKANSGTDVENHKTSSPWYDVYRDTFLDYLKQSDHETIKHYVSAVMIVSSTDSDPLESFSKLFTAQKQSEQSKCPKWLTPHVFYYYVLLHDVSEGGEGRAKENFEKVKASYGAGSCFFLQINSRPQGSPGENEVDIWLEYLGPGPEHKDDSEEVDGRFDLKFWKNAKESTKLKPSKNSPPLSSNEYQHLKNVNVPSVPILIDPKDAREEATLLYSSSSDSDSQNPNSVVVSPGSDPLSVSPSSSNQLPVVGETISHALSSGDFMMDEQRGTLSQLLSNGSNEGLAPSVVSKYGQYLSNGDRTRLYEFVKELGKKLLVHLCEVAKNLNEWLLSRRSVRRTFSLISSKFAKLIQGGPGQNVSDSATYASNSVEMQTRQLGDVAFFIQNYDLAFQSYHHVKKDFQSASSWRYYSAAVEMCATSAYMLSSTKKEVVSYLEEAISAYNLSCKAPYYTLRSSLILSEVLKERRLFMELTQLYIKMTTEDDDLKSALCLEQAANTFLCVQPPMSRKCALHLILAGHRFARSTQRVHSARVYQNALQEYCGKGWALAEDYIHFSLARHSFSLHRLFDAKVAFEALLCHENSQSPAQQLLNLKEYIFVHKQVLSAESARRTVSIYPSTSTSSQIESIHNLPSLPLPLVKSQFTRVTFLTSISSDAFNRPYCLERCNDKLRMGTVVAVPTQGSGNLVPDDNSPSKLATDSSIVSSSSGSNNTLTLGQHLASIKKEQEQNGSLTNLIIGATDYNPAKTRATKSEWENLEMKAAAGKGGSLHENFHPSVLMMDDTTDNSTIPFCVVREPISVGIVLKNPLHIPLLMSNLTLTWKYSLSFGESPTFASFFAASNDNPPTDTPPKASCEVIESVLLKPSEEKMVTLRITPLKEGQLQVLGFLYNLCVDASQTDDLESSLLSSNFRSNFPSMSISSQDVLYQKQQGTGVSEYVAEGIQGRVEINIQGPRLNHTKDERAEVVYGNDHRLQWIITSPMPKIIACLTSLPTTVYSGEVFRVGVEVYNCGQLPLNGLRLTSSLGGNILLDKECVQGSCSNSVYPSSILSPINCSPPPTSSHSMSSHPMAHTASGCIEFPLPNGRLEPGQCVCANLVMRVASSSMSAGLGEIPLNILFYYEPTLLTANSRLSHRVLYQTYILKLKESLYLKTTAVHGQLPVMTMPTLPPTVSISTQDGNERFDMNNVLVTIESENRCQLSSTVAAEVRVTQVSCVSREWNIKKMDREQKLLCLHPNESGVIHLRASRFDQPSLFLCHSDVPLGPTMIPSSDFPTGNLIRASESFKALELFGNESHTGNTKMESVVSDRIALIVFWQALLPGGADTQFSYGHNTITVKLPQSMSALSKTHSAQPSSTYDLVKFYLEHPNSHPYPSEKLVGISQIPVSIVLQNCCHDQVKCMVELLQPKDDSHEQKRHLEPPFFWSGSTCRRQIFLESQSFKRITVFANFCRPGMYNLNTLRVLVAQGDSNNYDVQRWQRTSFINIK